jgi:hypothetical protein
MGTLEAFADLFTDEPANFGSATPANVANPAKPRIGTSVPEVANACESLRIADNTEGKTTRFAAIRSHSQTAKPATECARSQDSQHSHGTNRKTFAESSNRQPVKPISRPVLRFKLTEGGGTVLGSPDDAPADLLADLRARWPGDLLAVWLGTEPIYQIDRVATA